MSLIQAGTERLVSLVEQFHAMPTETDPTERNAQLHRINEAYWETMLRWVKGLPFDLKVERFTVPFSDEPFVNYALLDEDVLPWWRDRRDEVERDRSAAGKGFPVEHVADGFGLTYREILRLEERERLHADGTRLARQVEAVSRHLDQTRRGRDQEQGRLLAEKDRREMERVNARFERVMIEFHPLVKRIYSHGLRNEDERRRFVEARRQIDRYLRDRDGVLSAYTEAAAIQGANKRIEKEFRIYMDLLDARIEAARRLDEAERARKELRVPDVRNAIREEIRHLSVQSRICAKRTKREPVAVPVFDVHLVTPSRIRDEIAAIEDFDPGVFQNRQVKKTGLPAARIVPAFGHAVYDWSRNRIIVPTMYPKTLRESLILGVVLYRLDVDKHQYDGGLLRSFGSDVKENADTDSVQKLRERFVRCYFLWFRKEVEGYPVFSVAMREWFERHIAPNKNEVIVPRGFRHLADREARQMLEIDALHEDGAEHHARRGVVFALLREYEAAKAEFDQAVRLEPERPEPWFSHGVVCRKLSMGGEARASFSRFVRLSGPSWWSRKAQEHLRHLH